MERPRSNGVINDVLRVEIPYLVIAECPVLIGSQSLNLGMTHIGDKQFWLLKQSTLKTQRTCCGTYLLQKLAHITPSLKLLLHIETHLYIV